MAYERTILFGFVLFVFFVHTDTKGLIKSYTSKKRQYIGQR